LDDEPKVVGVHLVLQSGEDAPEIPGLGLQEPAVLQLADRGHYHPGLELAGLFRPAHRLLEEGENSLVGLNQKPAHEIAAADQLLLPEALLVGLNDLQQGELRPQQGGVSEPGQQFAQQDHHLLPLDEVFLLVLGQFQKPPQVVVEVDYWQSSEAGQEVERVQDLDRGQLVAVAKQVVAYSLQQLWLLHSKVLAQLGDSEQHHELVFLDVFVKLALQEPFKALFHKYKGLRLRVCQLFVLLVL
jgi:hypothetical protein